MKNKLYIAISRSTLIVASFIIFICALKSSAQNLSSDDDGIKTIDKGDLRIAIDEFTGEITIGISDLSKLSNLYGNDSNNHQSPLMPLYNGKEDHLEEGFNFFDRLLGGNKDFHLIILNPKFDRNLTEEDEDLSVYFLVDGERNSKTAYHQKSEDQEQNKKILVIPFTEEEWEEVISSDTTKFRIAKEVFSLDENTKGLMAEIFKEYRTLKSEYEKQEESHIEETNIDDTNIDESSEKEISAPYELKWEGDLERSPMVQPLPENTSDTEATITIRFEVKPNGTIGRIIPLRETNPELEREVIRTLRSWRFSRLPSGVPQQSQWGIITFRFSRE